jgi:hypothetical protein
MHVSIDGRHGGRLRKRDNLLMGKGGGQGKGAKSYDALYYTLNTLCWSPKRIAFAEIIVVYYHI